MGLGGLIVEVADELRMRHRVSQSVTSVTFHQGVNREHLLSIGAALALR